MAIVNDILDFSKIEAGLSKPLQAPELQAALERWNMRFNISDAHFIDMRLLPVLIMVAAGFFISIQGPINARLRASVESPVLSAAISFLSGGLFLLAIMASGAFGGVGAGVRGMQSAPLWAYLGGVLGITFVLGSIVAIPQVGVVVVICAAILGQMVGSYLADTFGWFGVAQVPFSPVRLVGIALMLGGVLLVQRK